MNTWEEVSTRDLGCVDVFARLSDEQLEHIAKACILRNYKAGEYCASGNAPRAEVLTVNGGTVAIKVRRKHT